MLASLAAACQSWPVQDSIRGPEAQALQQAASLVCCEALRKQLQLGCLADEVSDVLTCSSKVWPASLQWRELLRRLQGHLTIHKVHAC